MSGESDLRALTDELYARPPAEFVARRDELARAARASGDRELAAQVKALRRPSVGAGYLNSGVRAELGALAEVMELGRRLRDAQAGGDFAALRELGSRRGTLVAAAMRELGAHLVVAGVSATPAGLDEARTTLSSALADPEVAAELAAGRLDRPHVYAGFGDASGWAVVTPAPARPSRDRPEAAAAEAAGAAQRAAEDARRAAEDVARQELEEAEADLAASADDHEAAQDAATAAADRVGVLTSALAEAKEALRAAKDELSEATTRQTAARRRVERARHGVPAPFGDSEDLLAPGSETD
jgi:hypothetical protein